MDAAKGQFDELECVVYGVNTATTDRLLDLRAHLRVDVHFLYDTMALTARAYGVSRKVRPLCRDAVYVIDKDNRVLLAESDHVGSHLGGHCICGDGGRFYRVGED